MLMKSYITYDEFQKIDIRVGKVVACEKKEGSDKLLRLTVDFGEEGNKNILSGIAAYYTPTDLIGKEFAFVINLQPRKLMGEESHGMILAADGKKPMPLKPRGKVTPGSIVL